MSIIDTPPGERIPVKTYVSEFSDSLIREAILREIDRQGQVYFLHNRVQNIDYMAERIKKLIPEASVSIAHGQMPEKQLEQSMVAFANGITNILVCTTIIESGLDIPNVNTLIVNRADAFGLSQLYQLRGRVGRSARRAYSYFLIPPSAQLTEAAEKRLKAILRATELGAGYQIAMKDLEIRGAGNILGSEQSGHIYAIGFNLYNQLLSSAVEQLRVSRASVDQNDTQNNPDSENLKLEEGWADKALRPQNTPRVDINIPASIPSDYIEDLSTRLGMYRRLISLQDTDAIIGIEDEFQDRFGPIPTILQNLFYVMRLKILANTCGVSSIVRSRDIVIVELFEETGGARQALQRRMDKGITVGNQQIRLDLEVLGIQWQKCLEKTLISVNDFKGEIDDRINSSTY
jgi:transcription-repair coupling factor (superfamily II helicase)